MVEQEQWRRLEKQLLRMYPEGRSIEKVCPFVPRTFGEYVQHRREMNNAMFEAQQRAFDAQRTSKKLGHPEKYMAPAFNGRMFGSCYSDDHPPIHVNPNPPNRGYVLAERTIWCPMRPEYGPPWRTNPRWPSRPELEWEGDQRVATENGRFGRYPPLPRKDYETDVPFHSREAVKPYPFDVVWPVPQMDDIYLPVDQIEDSDVISRLLNKDLLDAVENPPIPVEPRVIEKFVAQ